MLVATYKHQTRLPVNTGAQLLPSNPRGLSVSRFPKASRKERLPASRKLVARFEAFTFSYFAWPCGCRARGSPTTSRLANYFRPNGGRLKTHPNESEVGSNMGSKMGLMDFRSKIFRPCFRQTKRTAGSDTRFMKFPPGLVGPVLVGHAAVPQTTPAAQHGGQKKKATSTWVWVKIKPPGGPQVLVHIAAY